MTLQKLRPHRKTASGVETRRKIYIVDDHPIVRRGLRQLISLQKNLEVCGEAAALQGALDGIALHKPDLVLVDIALQGASGLELIRVIRARWKTLPILVVSMHDETLYAERALHNGAQGYIMKEENPEKMITAIEEILDGKIYLSEAMKTALIRPRKKAGAEGPRLTMETLSGRELEVFEFIGRGYSTRQIAEQLFLSVKTIESYRSQIKQKLNLPSSIRLVQRAFHWVENENKLVQPAS